MYTKHERIKYLHDYRIKNREKLRVKSKKIYKKLRLKALKIIGKNKIECVRCGCDDVRLLEINHKYGGGHKDYKLDTNLISNIARKHIKREDLEILCSPCNSIHYLELKYKSEIPLIVKHINVCWEKEL